MSSPALPSVASSERSRKLRSWTLIILTNVLSLVCLGWVLSGADLPRIWGEIKRMNYGWVTVAVVSDVMVYLLHGVRWRLMLRPVQVIPYGQFVRSIYVGLYANEILPLRAGELIRCFLLSRWSGIPMSVSFASALIERIFDGIWLMTCFFVALRMSHLPGVLVKGGYVLCVIILLGSALIGIGMYAKQQSLHWFFNISWPKWFNTLIEDLHLIGHSRYLYFSFLVSGLYLLAQMVPIYATIRAYGLPIPWTSAFIMMVLLRLSAVVPQAPGNLGSFQWVTARTLILFGIAQAYAKRFSLILWAVLTIPLIIVGALALFLTGIKMSSLHREATEAAAAKDQKA